MRTFTYKKRTLIAYDVEGSGDDVVINIVGVFHGGQHWKEALREVAAEPASSRPLSRRAGGFRCRRGALTKPWTR